MQLDPLDAKLLRLLREDARHSFRDLAEKTGSTVPTVSARVKALEDVGLIRGYHAQIDATLAGGQLVHATIRAKASDARRIATAVAKLDGATGVALLAGGIVHATIRLSPPERDAARLHDEIASLEGVIDYDVREVLATPDVAANDELPERVDVKCHQCQGPIHDVPVRKVIGEKAHVFCCRQCLADFQDRFLKIGAQASKPPAKPSPHKHGA